MNYEPRQPVEGFSFHIKALQFWGLWLPPKEQPIKRFLYKIYATFCLIAWLYFFVYTQALYLLSVDYTNISNLADALFFFFIQIVLIPKLYYLLKNIDRVQQCVKQLETPIFISQSDEEDKFVGVAIFRAQLFHRTVLSLCGSCVIAWITNIFLPESQKYTIIPAKFPWNYKEGVGFWCTFIYQFIAIIHSAFTHMTMDTLATGLLFHSAAQIHRLGLKISKVS